jgi:hypothetical protein
VEELLALVRRELLRVVQDRERTHLMFPQHAVVEEDRGSHEGAREASAAGLVSPGHEARPEPAIKIEELPARFAHGPENNG